MSEHKKKRLSIFELIMDSFFSTLLVFILIYFGPAIFSSRVFVPYLRAVSDFHITDIVLYNIFDRGLIPGDTNMVIINISGANNLGLARLLSQVSANEPKVIGIVNKLKPEGNANDTILADILHKTANLVLPSNLIMNKTTKEFKILKMPELFSNGLESGFTDLMAHSNQKYFTLREFYPLENAVNGREMSFSLKIASIYAPSETKRFLTRNKARETINWSAYRRFNSIFDWQELIKSNDLLGFIKGKIVILGNYDPENDPNKNPYIISDKYFTPLNEKYAGRAYPDMFEADIHTNLISMILNENFLYTVPSSLNYTVSVILCFLIMFLFVYIKKTIDPWYELLSVFIFVLFSMGLFFITIISFYLMKADLQLNKGLIALALSSPIFEAYYRSFKPATDRLIHKFSGRKDK